MTDLRKDGWIDWLGCPPPAKTLIVMQRFGNHAWDGPSVGYREQMSAEANAVGLYWKLTGIAKEAINERS